MKSRQSSKAIGKTALAIDHKLSDASVEAIYREGKRLELSRQRIIQAGDSVAITGTISVSSETASRFFGREVAAPNGLLLVQENREIILTNRALSGRTHRRDPRSGQRRNPSRRFPDGGQAHGAGSAAAATSSS